MATRNISLNYPDGSAAKIIAALKWHYGQMDNGAGKTQLMALFATGAAVQIAIEP